MPSGKGETEERERGTRRGGREREGGRGKEGTRGGRGREVGGGEGGEGGRKEDTRSDCKLVECIA